MRGCSSYPPKLSNVYESRQRGARGADQRVTTKRVTAKRLTEYQKALIFTRRPHASISGGGAMHHIGSTC